MSFVPKFPTCRRQEGVCSHALRLSVKQTDPSRYKTSLALWLELFLVFFIFSGIAAEIENPSKSHPNGNCCSLPTFSYPIAFLFFLELAQLGETIGFCKSLLNLSELAQRPLFSTHIITNASRERAEKTEWPEDDPPPTSDGRSSVSPNKEAILELFKRIQSSISKGETMKSRKRNTKDSEVKKLSAEPVLEVFEQSRTQPKGKTLPGKGNESAGQRKDEGDENSFIRSTFGSARLPSNFTKRSPIPTQTSPGGKIQSMKEIEVRATVSVPKEEREQKIETTSVASDKNAAESLKFDEMKLHQLKEAAKSRGIRGYSKLKKSELVELLMRSVEGAAAP